MARLIAFTCLTCAAFAWVPPGIDRAGLAALGLAFLAWSIGRGIRLPFTLSPRVQGPAALEHPERIQPLSPEFLQSYAKATQAEFAELDARD